MYRKKSTRGFTLIELLLVMGILALMMGVVVSNHSRFGGKVLLRTLAYDTALTIRQAQTFGISVRQSSATAGTEFTAGYGINIDTTTVTGTTNQFRMFSDISGNDGVFTSGSDTTTQTYNISRGYVISDLCVTTIAAPNTYVCNTATRMDIVFRRPEPDAEIRINGTVGTLYPKAKIEMRSPRGDIQNIIIEVSGQISVQ
jgi:prepilin-type N-terminal cleavage/methylation domain-containing protein